MKHIVLGSVHRLLSFSSSRGSSDLSITSHNGSCLATHKQNFVNCFYPACKSFVKVIMGEQEFVGLPLLPGLTFEDPTKSKFHRSQFFEFKQGGRHMKHYAPAAGKYPRDIDSVRYLDLENDAIV